MADFLAEPYLDERHIEMPLPAIRAGMTGEPEVLKTGGDKAVGTITFAANPSNNDTVTLNGTVWTFVTSGASGNQTNIGVNLGATLTQLATDLNASADAEVVKVTWTENGAVLTGTYDTVGVAGNSYSLAASAATAQAKLSGGEDSTAISLTTEYTDIAIKSGETQDQRFTLADGYEGQKKCIFLSAKQAGNVVVTPTNLHGGTTITFDAEKEATDLRFVGGGWKSVGGDATVA